MTVTSGLHAQAERTNKQISLHPLEAKTKAQRVVSKHEGVTDGYVPEKPTPTLLVNLRADIVFLVKGLEESGSSFVGNDVRQPKQFPVNASTIGDYRRQEGLTLVGLVERVLDDDVLVAYPISPH